MNPFDVIGVLVVFGVWLSGVAFGIWGVPVLCIMFVGKKEPDWRDRPWKQPPPPPMSATPPSIKAMEGTGSELVIRMNPNTATGEDLDRFGQLVGIQRELWEPDAPYRERMLAISPDAVTGCADDQTFTDAEVHIMSNYIGEGADLEACGVRIEQSTEVIGSRIKPICSLDIRACVVTTCAGSMILAEGGAFECTDCHTIFRPGKVAQ